jgi:S1-C subfamily serine protease
MLKRIVISVFLLVLALGLTALAQDEQGQAYLGIFFDEDDAGVLVTRVLPGSPADDADLQRGDIITALGGEPVTAENLPNMVLDHQPGDTLDLTVLRDEENLDLSVTLGTRPETPQPFTFRFQEGFQGNAIGYNGADQTWTIQGLSEDSPLYEAGLREGDIVTAFNGESYDPQALNEFVAGLDDNETVTLTIERDGESMDLDVPADALTAFGMGFGPGFRGEGNSPFEMMPFGMFGGGSRLGVSFVTLDEQVAQENNVDATEGALIVEVAPDSPAADAGLQADDVVTAVNNEVVDAEHTLRDRLVAYEPGDTITLSVLRGAETMDIEVTLGQPEITSDFMPFFGQHGFGPDGFFQFQQPEAPVVPQPNA